MNKIKTFIYTDLATKETIHQDFKTKKQIDKFFDPNTMYPVAIVDKLVYPTGCYWVLKESYCV